MSIRTIFAGLMLAVLSILPASAQQDGFPLTVEHALGAVTIPSAPQRVVALMDRDVDTLLALGIVPVGIRSWYGHEGGVGSWAHDLLGGAEPVVWTGRELNYEAIAALEPDLIVFASSGGDADEYGMLSLIAPTLSLPKGELAWGSTTAGTTRLIAEAVDKAVEGEALLAGLADYLAAQKAAHPEFAGHTANYVDVHDGGLTFYSRSQFINATLYDLGFSPVKAVLDMEEDDSYVTTSDEQAELVDADIMLIYPFGKTLPAMLESHPTLQTLDAFKRKRALILPDLAFSQASVLSIPYALGRLVPQFAAALGQ